MKHRREAGAAKQKKAGPSGALPFMIEDVSAPLFFEFSPQPQQAQQAGAQEPD